MKRRLWISIACEMVAAPCLVAGCGGVSIPQRLEVRDVTSGTTYTTYQPWARVERGIGYEFTDIESGRKVNLTNYEVRTVESQKSVPGDSAEAQSYEAAKVRGGVK